MSVSLRSSCRAVIMLIFLGAAIFSLVSCVEPSPFYGTWSDNKGNTFSFFDDGTFDANIARAGSTESYGGNYSILMNVLSLDCTEMEMRVVTEWDIRGNILYMDWTSADGNIVSLSLYKVAN